MPRVSPRGQRVKRMLTSQAGPYCLPFSQIGKGSVALCGGKGASLGEMAGAKIPVPPGFVVSAPAFDRFTDQTDLNEEIAAQLKLVQPDDTNSVDRASNVIRDLIHDEPFPEALGKEIITSWKQLKAKYVAVRSSATAEDSAVTSWAGELETYLNTTGATLLENVKRCWSSLFTPRAIFYRFQHHLEDQQVSVAVVVQEMVESEISGVAFTVHPVTRDRNQMIIEAGWGLGEAIVSGQITPDSYIVSKKDWAIQDVQVAEQEQMIVRARGGNNSTPSAPLPKRAVHQARSDGPAPLGEGGADRGNQHVPVPTGKRSKQKLTSRQIIELAKLCGRIEQHYGFPCDIEWAFADGRFWITQSRPITTLK